MCVFYKCISPCLLILIVFVYTKVHTFFIVLSLLIVFSMIYSVASKRIMCSPLQKTKKYYFIFSLIFL